jgi:hypothetical protein
MDRLSMSLFDAAVNLNPHQIEAALFALQTIKEIEQRLGDASVRLQSFIVSNTPSHTMKQLWNMDKPAMVARHILFQEEDKGTYIRSMLEAVGPAGTSTAADALLS